VKKFIIITIFLTISGLLSHSCNESVDEESGNNQIDKVENDSEQPDSEVEEKDDENLFFNAAFQIKIVQSSDGGYTSLVGKIYDGPTPESIVWEETDTIEDCRLLKPRVPFCESSCDGGAICVEDNVCMEYPDAVNGGKIKVSGMKTVSGNSEIQIEPVANSYQIPGDVSLEFPAFSEESEVTISLEEGSVVPGFSVTANGISPLKFTSDFLDLSYSEPLKLIWEKAADGGGSIIEVVLDISHHGGTKGKILCLTADDGSAEIASSLMGKLLDLGVSGFPTIKVVRKSSGSDQLSNSKIELFITSTVEKEVLIEGLVSCWSDEDCPDGMKCQSDKVCR